MSENLELTIYTDGGARGNPGPAAYAYVIQRPGLADIEEKAFMGRSTNNIAEYTGLVKALEHARHLGASRVTILSDSELMVKQMNGEYRVKNEGLRPLYEQATALRRQLPSVTIRHVRREQNKHADRLCNEALDFPEDNLPFPVSLPPAEPAAAVVPAPSAEPTAEDKQEMARLRALQILSDSARQWAQGDATTPAPAAVWSQLWQMLAEMRQVRRPKRTGKNSPKV